MNMHKTYALALLLAAFGLVQLLAAGQALATDPIDAAMQQERLSQQQSASRRLGAGSQIPASQAAMRGQYGAVPHGQPDYGRTSVPNIQGRLEGGPSGMVRPATVDPAPIAAPPAWGVGPYQGSEAAQLQPYGANLFTGNFSSTYHDGLQPQYVIMPGDRILLRIWGAVTYDDVLVVDQQGNIFIPEVGPVHVGGLQHSQLKNAVKQQLSTVFTSNVDVYTNLLNTQPVAVFVTGNVAKPGRYAGGPDDGIMYYLDRAGGILPSQGSYRRVEVKRDGRTVAAVDLYGFIASGTLPRLRMQAGDVVLVGEKGPSVSCLGLLRQPARYELSRRGGTGASLLGTCRLLPAATHASVAGTRNGEAFNRYLSIAEFKSFVLQDEDVVEFLADKPGGTIMVGATGAIAGASRFPVRKGATLKELLCWLEVDKELANTSAIYLRRRSVAEQQKRSLKESLIRLEQTALTAPSSSVDEATIRVKEAELVQDFVKRAANIEPDGVVVVSRKGQLTDLVLEEGDIVYVPQRSDVVTITGEVMMPKTVVYGEKLSVRDYAKSAGGFTERADKSNVLVIKPNGETGYAKDMGIGPGDQLLVMPEYDTKGVQILKDIVQIMYQVAVSAGVVLVPLWR